jgi:hypothetical protein
MAEHLQAEQLESMATRTHKEITMKIQIDDVVRDATSEEIEVIEKIQADSLKKEEAAQADATAKAALLEKLGITAEEASLLLA